MKDVLIYARENDLRNTGGPRGYLFNIKDLILESSTDKNFNVSFLPKNNLNIEAKKSSKTTSYLRTPLMHLNWVFPLIGIINLFMSKGNKELLEFDIIHFHGTHELFSNRKLIKNKIVIIQTHSPVPPHKEYYDVNRLSTHAKLLKPYLMILRALYSQFDNFAFKKANYIIFPNEFSMDAYLKVPKLNKILNLKKDNIHFVISGILDPIKNYKIPKERTNSYISFGYLGRHNIVKGYDRFVKVMGAAIRQNPNLNVIVGGGLNKRIKFPKSTLWNELGWIDQNIFFDSIDVLVVPNRETYFDLVILEALAFGKVILISYTGGNKYFMKFKELINSSIFFFENDEDFISKINEISRMGKKTLSHFGMNNREIFLNNFQAKNMVDDYIKFLNGIVLVDWFWVSWNPFFV